MSNNTNRAAEAAQPATASGDERADFETWIKSRLGYPFAGTFTNLMWDAWQARAAVSAATKPTADLGKLARYDIMHYEDGALMEALADGDFVYFRDVQSLLATKPAAAPAVPEGFVIVPKVPTRDMIAKTVDIVFEGAVEDAEVITEVYTAMIAAVPTPCTNSDSWNCKYCRKTATCEALKDESNFGTPAASTPAATDDVVYAYECRQPRTDPIIWCEFFGRDEPKDSIWARNVRRYVAASTTGAAQTADPSHVLPICAAPKGPFADYSAEEVEAFAEEYAAKVQESAAKRYRFLLSFLIERGVLHRYDNGVWRLRGIYGVDDSGLKGAGRTPEEALDNAIVAVNIDPAAAEKFWRTSCESAIASEGDFLPRRDVADEIMLLSNVMREHPQLKPVLGREALLMRCVRKALVAPAASTTGATQTAEQVRDAERYQYLRDRRFICGSAPEHGTCWVVSYHHPKGTIPEMRSAGYGAELDAAIDAAMARPTPTHSSEAGDA